MRVPEQGINRPLNRSESNLLATLFKQHLKEQHNIETSQDFEPRFIREHLEGRHTLIPLSIFSNNKLTALEAVVKYLRENERLSNSRTALIIGRTPAATWITYRNAVKKLVKEFTIQNPDIAVPSSALRSESLSPLESISIYMKEQQGMHYSKIAAILNRDQRTIWTVCNRARRKMAR